MHVELRLLMILTVGKSHLFMVLNVIQLVCRISAVPSFPGLRRFPDGRDFKQWTGDDSKALMKVSSVDLFTLPFQPHPLTGISHCNRWPCSIRNGQMPSRIHALLLSRTM